MTLVTLVAAGVAPGAQPPAFDVVSIRRNLSGSQHTSIRRQAGGGLNATNVTLRALVRTAYQLPDYQIAGGPDWITTHRFDVVAIGGPADASLEVLTAKLQALLADRFGLVARREMREVPTYELVMPAPGRPGPRLRPSTADCAGLAAARARGEAQSGTVPTCGTARGGAGEMTASGVTMAELARNLSAGAGRLIVDRTGLAGGYDFDLSWAADPEATAGPSPGDRATDTRPSLFAAVQEQLGLKLEPRRGLVDVLVIDRAALPAEN